MTMSSNHAVVHRRLLLMAGAVLACAAMLAAVAAMPAAAQTRMATKQLARQGFGDQRNSYAWSMAWFKGKLYVGTARQELCVENATLDFYYPGRGYYTPNPASDINCPPNMYDMDLQAEIWQYNPGTRHWKRVYQSPLDVTNPRAPGKLVPRDIAFRGMTVYRGQLYVGGVTADEYIPELAGVTRPRILRTSDGENFKALPQSPHTIHTFLGVQKPIGYRSMVVYKDRLYVTASSGLTGDGVVLRVDSPSGKRPHFRQISPPNLQVFEMQPFNGQLYVGTGSNATGYGVYRTRAEQGSSSRFIPVVSDGAGRGREITSVVSMGAFKDRLYVGASGWFTGSLLAESELIRVNKRNRWELVAGKARATSTGLKAPISGLPDGFGNIFNTHFWRMANVRGALMVGTNDSSWGMREIPIVGPTLAPEYGFDIYGSCDGRFWWPVTKNAFGDGRYNFGARTMITNPKGRGFFGSANHAQGTSVWRGGIAPMCSSDGKGARASAAAVAPSSPHQAKPDVARPARALADVERCGTVVSWDRSPGATRYRVLRADDRLLRDVPLPERRVLPDGAVPDDPLQGPFTRRGDLTLPGAWQDVGTTSRSWFVDRSATGAGHRYQVVAESAHGPASPPSNLAFGVVRPSSLRALAHISRRGTAEDASMTRLAIERRARYSGVSCGS